MPAIDPLTPDRETEIEQALLELQCNDAWFQVFDDKEKRTYLKEHVRGRYDIVRHWVIPWIQAVVDLKKCHVVEIGCGTGSTSAALALESLALDSYDIASNAVKMARKRAEILGLSNVTFHCHPAERLIEQLLHSQRSQSVDVVVCFAMLEHATHRERQRTLRAAWELLAPGGLLVIGDTPNRLSYWDSHTTWLPFFECLPHEVAVDYFNRSPRAGHVKNMQVAAARSLDAAVERLTRLGRGVSYHDFELAIGDVHSLVVGDGFDPEPLAYYNVSDETRCMVSYALSKQLGVHPAFLRSTIDVILRKPGGRDAKPQRPRDLAGIVRPFSSTAAWTLNVTAENEAQLFHSLDGSRTLRVQFGRMSNPKSWAVQIRGRAMAAQRARRYRVAFRARADAPRDICVAFKQSRAPWANAGLSERVPLGASWAPLDFVFRPHLDCDEARLVFELGGNPVPVEIADITIDDLGE